MRNWLKIIRIAHEKTQHDIAKSIGISTNLYCCIETGKRGVTVENAKKIAKALNFDWTRFYSDGNAKVS